MIESPLILQILFVLGGLINAWGISLYIRDVYRGTNKPNLVGWAIWALLPGIATGAALLSGVFTWTVLFTGIITILPTAVVLACLHRGVWQFDRVDRAMLVAIVVVLAAWWYSGSAELTVFFTILIDVCGSVLVIRHAYQKPNEESIHGYTSAIPLAAFAVLGAQGSTVLALGYPLWILLLNVSIALLIVFPRFRFSYLRYA